jgi:hypothetical protein
MSMTRIPNETPEQRAERLITKVYERSPLKTAP